MRPANPPVRRSLRPTTPGIRPLPPAPKTHPVIGTKTQPTIAPRLPPASAPRHQPSLTPRPVPAPGARTQPLVAGYSATAGTGARAKPQTRTGTGFRAYGAGKQDEREAGADKNRKGATQPSPLLIAGIAGGVLFFVVLLVIIVSANQRPKPPPVVVAPRPPPTTYSSGPRRTVTPWRPEKAKPMAELDGRSMGDYMRENELDKNPLLIERQERVREHETRKKPKPTTEKTE